MAMSGGRCCHCLFLSVQRELEKGDLVQVPIEGLELRPQLSLIQRADKQLSGAAETFCSFLRPALDEALDFHPVSFKTKVIFAWLTRW